MNDTIIGNASANNLDGSSGNDELRGMGGDDVLSGSAGDDVLYGGAGYDVFDGGAGTDWVSYEDATAAIGIDLNFVNGTANAGDALWETYTSIEGFAGSNFNDTFTGGAAADSVATLNGNDAAAMGAGNDIVWAGSGNDTITGQGGNDRIYGDSGNDQISGNAGNDTLTGGAGNDTILAGDGTDVISYSGSLSQYDFTKFGNDVLVTHMSGGSDGVDWVEDAESFQFADQTVAFANLPNRTGPNFTPASYTFSAKEDSQIIPAGWPGAGGEVANDTDWWDVVGTVTATDPNGDAVTGYRINSGQYLGSHEMFQINSSGQILATNVDYLDYENASARQFVLEVQAKDSWGNWGETVNVTINITDLKDHKLNAWWWDTSGTGQAGQAQNGHSVVYWVTNHGSWYATYNWHIKNSGGATIATYSDDNWTSGMDRSWVNSNYKQVGWPTGWGIDFLTPVVLDLDGDGAELLSFQESQVAFDMDGDGVLERTGWAGADDGMLALDRNGDGVIGDGSEISFVQDLEGATTDMEGLAAFDTNGDGAISALDDAYGDFVVWQDRNQDGISQADELTSLADAGIVSIGLDLESTGQTTDGATDNVVFNTAWYEAADGTKGEIADSAFAYEDQAAGSIADEDVAKLIQAMASFGGPSGIDLDLKDKTFGQEQNPASTLAVHPYV